MRIAFDAESERAFEQFMHKEQLTEKQIKQFKCYTSLICEYNERFNLTTITNIPRIITRHFQDSLIVKNDIDFNILKMVADVGSGAGFPGIPLKIYFPHLSVLLIEVNNKKISFLSTVIAELGLEKIEIIAIDWRTFLRKTDYPIDLFVARASVVPEELIRMFRQTSAYKNKSVIYWASKTWQPGKKDALYVQKEYEYTLDDTKRRLIVFSQNK